MFKNLERNDVVTNMVLRRKIKFDDIRIIIDFLFAFLLIYFTRTMWPSIENLGLVDFAMKLIFVVVLVAKVMTSKLYKKNCHKILLSMILVLYMMAFIVIKPINIEYYFKMVMFAAGTVVFQLCETNKHNALKYYSHIILFLSVLSLVFWLFGSVLEFIKPSENVYSLWSGSDKPLLVPTYYNLHYEPQKADFLSFGQITRNTGVFSEAPMFCLHVSIALLYELFEKETANKKKCIVFLATIITSFSMTGYIVAAVAFTLKYFFISEKKVQIVKVILFPAIMIVLSIFLENIMVEKLGSFSGGARIDDFRAGYLAWIDSPLVGNGYNNIKSIQSYMSSFRMWNTGFSNSPMLILAYGGFYLAVPYIVATIASIKNSMHSKARMCFLLLFLFILMITVVPFQPFIFYLFCWFSNNNFSRGNSIKRSCRKVYANCK